MFRIIGLYYTPKLSAIFIFSRFSEMRSFNQTTSHKQTQIKRNLTQSICHATENKDYSNATPHPFSQ